MNSLAFSAARRMSMRSSAVVASLLSRTPMSHVAPAFRTMSTTSRPVLLDLITREHTEEVEEGRTDIPEQLAELQATLKENAWKIVDDEGFTKLVREHNGMKMQLSFHCQDTIQEDEPHFEEEGDENEEPEDAMEEDGEEAPGSLRFVATATPTKTGKTLVFQCTSEFGGSIIDAVSVSKDDNIEHLHTGDAKHNEYTGPVFAELPEDVKDEFHNFLEVDVGVNADVSNFIHVYADYKEQQHYVKFLEDVKEVLK